MATKQLTAARLKELLEYDPASGEFTWKPRPAGSTRAGDGRRTIRIDGKLYLANRLAWLFMTGVWPAGLVDHEDTNPSNDAWGNLRNLTPALNAQNRRRAGPLSSTGFLGVSRNGARFQAVLTLNGKRHRFGTFDTPEEAHAAYVQGKRRLHPAGTL